MTVNYINKIHSIPHHAALLFNWRGSIYKLIWKELVIYMILSFCIQIIITASLNKEQHRVYLKFSEYCLTLSRVIPVAFVLPFFVRLVINRRFEQFKHIPWIDKLAIYLATFMEGESFFITATKRTIVRYCVLSLAFCFKSISIGAQRKFENYDVFVESGLATTEELDKLSVLEFKYNNYFTPILWASELLKRADIRGAIIGEGCVTSLLNEITNFHRELQSLFFYDWINVPLVYTQVSSFCVYAYFITALFGANVIGQTLFQQYLSASNNTLITDNLFAAKTFSWVPMFEIINFGVYMGWLKVAESMINPYGDDDEDFETVELIQRNLQIGYMMVDKRFSEVPTLTEDVVPVCLQVDFKEVGQNFFSESRWQFTDYDK